MQSRRCQALPYQWPGGRKLMPQLPRPVNDPTSAACYVKYHSSNRWRRRWRRSRRSAQIGFTRSSSTAGGLRSTSKAALPRSTVRTGPTTRNDFEPCATIAGIPAKSAIIDCELVACDETGMPCFRTLMELGNKAPGLCLWCFDLLSIDGARITPLPLQMPDRDAQDKSGRLDHPREVRVGPRAAVLQRF